MNKALLDTDILSEIFKNVDQTVLRNAAEYLNWHPQLSFTSVSVYEAIYGFRSSRPPRMRQLTTFLELIADHEEVLPEFEDYRLAADIRAVMHVMGTPVGTIDPIIAACAVRRNLPLITGNTRHHGFIQKAGFALQLVNWRELQS